MTYSVTKWLPGNYRSRSGQPPDAAALDPESVAPDGPWLTLRRDGAQLHLRWPAAWMGGGAALHGTFVGAQHPAFRATGGVTRLTLPLPDMPRVALRLRLAGGPLDGRSRLVAERGVPFATLFNVRDIGGYPADDGRHVRYGLLYRAGVPTPETDHDRRRLAALGIRHVWDLRSPREAARQPVQLPWAHFYTHTPLQNPIGRWRQVTALLRHRRELAVLLLRGYTEVAIDHNAPIFGALLRRLAEPDAMPFMVHCSAGKDRTGIAVALLLRLLGVAEPLVVAEYALSNDFAAAIAASLAPELARLRRFGVTADRVRPLLAADPAIMTAALRHIDRAYGSLDAYLTGPAGVSAADIDRLRARFLET